MSNPSVKNIVLIIDDSPFELRAISSILAGQFEVLLAKNGKSGIELAIRNRVDLILVDLNMPDMSGFEVLAELKSMDETAHVPVIIITGSESSEDEVKGLALGASDFIRKPFVGAVVNLRVNMHIKLRNYIHTIERLSTIDGLTGISNRRGFDQIVKVEWSRAARKREWLGMLILDIDLFKNFNDKYGHLNGDTCLKIVAQVMVDAVARGNDFVFRWGGEEFVALLPDTSIDGVMAVAERIRTKLTKTEIYCDDEVTTVTASIGAGAIIPPVSSSSKNKSEGLEEFFIRLDKALYCAKESGRNKVVAINMV